eukprot:scaffold14737_cov68-Phaeocystis_antarctica.AAC.3
MEANADDQPAPCALRLMPGPRPHGGDEDARDEGEAIPRGRHSRAAAVERYESYGEVEHEQEDGPRRVIGVLEVVSAPLVCEADRGREVGIENQKQHEEHVHHAVADVAPARQQPS